MSSVLGLFVMVAWAAQPEPSGPLNPESTITRGAEIFAANCAVCHGATGLGLVEAREAFPEDHQRCERCHRPGNPPTMSLAEIETRQHDLFSLGAPPALRGSGTLSATLDAASLQAYLRATMPRYRPGTLSEEEYRALSYFLMDLNDRSVPY